MCRIEILRYAEGHIATLTTVPTISVSWAADRGRRCNRKGQALQNRKNNLDLELSVFVILYSHVREGQSPTSKDIKPLQVL